MLEEHAATRSTVQLRALLATYALPDVVPSTCAGGRAPEAFAPADVLRPHSCRRMGAGGLRVDEGAAGAPCAATSVASTDPTAGTRGSRA